MFLRKYAEFPPFLPPRISPKKIAGRNKKKKEKNSIRGKRVKSRKNIHFSLFSPSGWLFPFFLLQANTSMPTFSFFPKKTLKRAKESSRKNKKNLPNIFSPSSNSWFCFVVFGTIFHIWERGVYNFGRGGRRSIVFEQFWGGKRKKISLTDPLRPGAPKRGRNSENNNSMEFPPNNLEKKVKEKKNNLKITTFRGKGRGRGGECPFRHLIKKSDEAFFFFSRKKGQSESSLPPPPLTGASKARRERKEGIPFSDFTSLSLFCCPRPSYQDSLSPLLSFALEERKKKKKNGPRSRSHKKRGINFS